jgi:signal transduction histidine kinase/PAS domain-containing protein
MGKTPMGLLILRAPPGMNFQPFDVHLANCLLDVLGTNFGSTTSIKLLNYLRFCILHRKHFLSSTPSVQDVVTAFLSRLVMAAGEYLAVPKPGRVFANLRLVDHPIDVIKDVSVIKFAGAMGVGYSGRAQLRKYEFQLKSADIRKWIGEWGQFRGRVPADVDHNYKMLFPQARSHVAVPCSYHGHLHGILSVDSPYPNIFDKHVVEAISIVGAQAAPIIANAMRRESLLAEREYLKNVLDAIPDELFIIDKNARIASMNKAKKDKFRKARVGDFCYKRFEYDKDSPCIGCYALRALRKGIPVKQAIWRYPDVRSGETGYVEISAGRIASTRGRGHQAVEVVRYVTAREALLEWMTHMQDYLLLAHRDRVVARKHDPKIIAELLWKDIALGLKQMQFPRYRLYVFKPPQFLVGKECYPKSYYKGGNFTQFKLDVETDRPSWVTLRDKAFRPVHFIVDPKRKREWYIPDREKEWNYLTCYLSQIPPECAKSFRWHSNTWIEVPIRVGDQIYGKFSVDKGPGDALAENQYITAYDMAILASFGRFASVVLHCAMQLAKLAEVDELIAIKDFSNRLAHELDNLNLALHTDLQYIKRKLPELLRTASLSLGFKSLNEHGSEALFEHIMNGLFQHDFLEPPKEGLYETKQVGRITKSVRKVGLQCSEKDIVPFINAGVGDSFMSLLLSPDNNWVREQVKRLLLLSNLLLRLCRIADAECVLSRIRANLVLFSVRHMPDVKPIDLLETIRGAIRIVTTGMSEEAVVELKKPMFALPRIPSYPESLRHVWVNLLQNAFQNMGGKGKVIVDVQRKQQKVLVKITDRGPGLPEGVASWLSEPIPPGSRIVGPNLGFKLVKSILQAHGGSIRAISSGPSGTTLLVRLSLKGAKGI